MQSSIFVVNEEPYCIWEVDILERNNEFLNGIDTEYFDYALKVHIEADDEKRASIALRATLHHATETMFSLLGAYIQAPDCAYAWIAKCKNESLRELIGKISASRNDLFTKLNIEKVSWECVAESVFLSYVPETEKNQETVRLFASLWKRLSNEYINQNNIDEYNSIKHGFRIRSGGFALAAGLEHEFGVSPSPEEIKLIGKSEFGTKFFSIEPVGADKRNRSLRSRRTSQNWKVEKVALLIQLVSLSITNITSALKIKNGAKAGTCNFARPQENSDFEKPWLYSPGVISGKLNYVIPEEQITSFTKSELQKVINDAKKS